MPRKALGFKVTELSEEEKLFQIDGLSKIVSVKAEITDEFIGSGKMTIEINFVSGLKIIGADQVIHQNDEDGFLLTSENDMTKIIASLNNATMTFASFYEDSSLTINIDLSGKAGGSVGGKKVGGNSVATSPYDWP